MNKNEPPPPPKLNQLMKHVALSIKTSQWYTLPPLSDQKSVIGIPHDPRPLVSTLGTIRLGNMPINSSSLPQNNKAVNNKTRDRQRPIHSFFLFPGCIIGSLGGESPCRLSTLRKAHVACLGRLFISMSLTPSHVACRI